MSQSPLSQSLALGLSVLIATASPVAFAAVPKPRTSVPSAPVVKKGPEAAAEYKKNADDLKKAGRVEDAIAEYQKALEADPAHVPAMQDLGRTLYEKGKWSDAAGSFKKLVQANPQDPAGWYNLGYALRKQGDLAGSMDAFAKYTQAMPDDPDGFYALAEVYRKLGRKEEAAQNYDLYAQKETRPSESDWVEKAKAKADAARAGATAVAAAAPVATREVEVAAVTPAPKPVGLGLTATPVATREVEPAATPVVAPAAAPAVAPAATPVTAPTLVAAATPTVAPVTAPAPAPVAAPVTAPAQPALAFEAKPAAAVPAPAPLRTRDPTAAIYKIREGDSMYQQKKFREALFAYQDAVKLDDQSTNAMLKLGLAYASLNYFQDAIKHWERVLELDPANQYAKTYIERAKPRLAQAAAPADQPKPLEATPAATPQPAAQPAQGGLLAQAAAVAPADDAAAKDAYRQAVQLMNASRYPEAVTQLGTAIQKNPNFVNAYVARGGAYLGLRSYNEAAQDYVKALQLDNTLSTPLYGLARVYERLNDRAKACDFYRRYSQSNGRDAQPQLKAQAAKQAEAICGG